MAGDTPFEQHLARSLEHIHDSLMDLSAAVGNATAQMANLQTAYAKLRCQQHAEAIERLDRRAWFAGRLTAAAITTAGLLIGLAHLALNWWKGKAP